MRHGTRLRLTLHLLAGGVFILFALVVDRLTGLAPEWGRQQTLSLALGVVVILLGIVPMPALLQRWSMNLCTMIVAVAFAVGLMESLSRLAGIDFAHEEEVWRRTPPYFRQPIVPTGEAFFRRPGPETWRGQVLNTRAVQLHVQPNPYADERAVTVRYDEHGFRDDGLTEWEIAVAGDSFTELGYLADDELYTAKIAEKLHTRVRNLGTSYTGPLTQLSYLRDYGITKATKQVVVVFFEGNDLEDLEREALSLARFRTTGLREYREFKRQTSALKAIDATLRQTMGWLRPTRFVEAYFESATGEVPITLTYTPPWRSQLTPATLTQLEDFARSYASLANEHSVTPWIVYMPCKLRVLYGQLRFPPGAPARIQTWTPSDLPDVIRELSAIHGIRFTDLTPALIAETRRTKTLLYNSIFDSHLNREGAAVVGRVLAEELGRDSGGERF